MLGHGLCFCALLLCAPGSGPTEPACAVPLGGRPLPFRPPHSLVPRGGSPPLAGRAAVPEDPRHSLEVYTLVREVPEYLEVVP